MKIAGYIAGVGLVAGLAWLLFFSNEPTLPESTSGFSPGLSLPSEERPVRRPSEDAPVVALAASAAVPEELESPDDLLALFDAEAVTHRAVRDGDWADPATWGGEVPKAGARVHIPSDREVRIVGEDDTHLKAITIDGALIMAHDRNTSLLVDTLLVRADGRFQAGTAAQPVQPDSEALIAILPYYDANESAAAREHSAMLLALGEVSLHGSPKSALVALQSPPQVGDQTLYLEASPDSWEPDDLLAVAGNRLTRDEGETLMLVGLDGRRASVVDAEQPEDWQGLVGDYQPDRDRLSFVVNLSRNVALSSAPPDGSSAITQGAALFMADGVGQASLANVGVYGFGMVEGTVDGAATPQTRPALSFVDGNGTAEISNLALIDAPESSLHVENSQVAISNSVAYDEDGASWLTETATPSRLLWAGKRSAPGALRTP